MKPLPAWTLHADKDAYVAEDAPDANHGGAPLLLVESKVLLRAANKRLLCSFDLRALPASAARVVRAVLRLTPERTTRGRALRCHQVTGAWDEASVTWNNQPGVGADHGVRASEATPHEWDVTGSVQAAFPHGRAEFRVKDDAEGALLSCTQEYPSRERAGAAVLEVVYEAQRSASLASSARPWLGGYAHLQATFRVAMAGSEDLPSWLRLRLLGAADLAATLRLRLVRSASLASSVRTPGAPSPMVPGLLSDGSGAARLAEEFLRLCEEAGSTIAHESRGRTRTLRRVVQLVDTHHTRGFPRAVTSEQGRPSTQDLLRRGDAILYAAGADQFEPGDMVEWQGRSWVVVGSLGAEMVGDTAVYQEVGLRRLSVTAVARVQGEVGPSSP